MIAYEEQSGAMDKVPTKRLKRRRRYMLDKKDKKRWKSVSQALIKGREDLLDFLRFDKCKLNCDRYWNCRGENPACVSASFQWDEKDQHVRDYLKKRNLWCKRLQRGEVADWLWLE